MDGAQWTYTSCIEVTSAVETYSTHQCHCDGTFIPANDTWKLPGNYLEISEEAVEYVFQV